MGSTINGKKFERCYAYFSDSLYSIHRKWRKVTRYGKRLHVFPLDKQVNYRNDYLSWNEPEEVNDPLKSQVLIAKHHAESISCGGYRRLRLTGI
jgi:pyrimidine precursor biosynthesis enzyme